MVTDACFIVRDANGQALAYVHFEEEQGLRPNSSHAMTCWHQCNCQQMASVHRFQVEYPLDVPSAQLIWVTPTNVPSPLMPSYFPVPPV